MRKAQSWNSIEVVQGTTPLCARGEPSSLAELGRPPKSRSVLKYARSKGPSTTSEGSRPHQRSGPFVLACARGDLNPHARKDTAT